MINDGNFMRSFEKREPTPEALEYFYDEMLSNYDEDDKGEIFDGFDD